MVFTAQIFNNFESDIQNVFSLLLWYIFILCIDNDWDQADSETDLIKSRMLGQYRHVM